MKLYKTTITSLSSFGTTLKGDTIFGHICWAICLKNKNRLNELLKGYEKEPFLVVSDAFVSGYFPKPTAPSTMLGENLADKKVNRKKVWLNWEDLQNGDFSLAKSDDELKKPMVTFLSIKNKINRLTFTTDGGDFAPYSMSEYMTVPQDVYFLLDTDKMSLDELKDAFSLVGKMGYGKKASIGKGRFEVGEFCEIESFLNENSNAFMTLSPSSLENFSEIYYEPFTRFGKHGASLASDKPFKSPVLLAQSGALIVPNDDEKTKIQKAAYIGKGIKGHSSHEESVQQGYAIVVGTKVIK
ncbi:MAG: hypothetical protein MR782_00315 [Campylobacter sp.]|nr:hypothetical protein [Campylobacter sp.]